jgi:hypothetical protein
VSYFGELFFSIRIFTLGWKQAASERYRLFLCICDNGKVLVNLGDMHITYIETVSEICVTNEKYRCCRHKKELYSVVLPIKYHSSDQIKQTEMGMTCGTYGEKGRCIQGVSGETWGKKTTWKTQA